MADQEQPRRNKFVDDIPDGETDKYWTFLPPPGMPTLEQFTQMLRGNRQRLKPEIRAKLDDPQALRELWLAHLKKHKKSSEGA